MYILDKQLAVFKDRLYNEIGLDLDAVTKIATVVAADIQFLSASAKNEIKKSSPIPFSDRLEELIAFQSWSEFATSIKNKPEITRASVITQNYISATRPIWL